MIEEIKEEEERQIFKIIESLEKEEVELAEYMANLDSD